VSFLTERRKEEENEEKEGEEEGKRSIHSVVSLVSRAALHAAARDLFDYLQVRVAPEYRGIFLLTDILKYRIPPPL